MLAWRQCDVDSLVALLREDAVLHMPPPVRYVGRDAIVGLLRTIPARGRLERIRLVAMRQSAQPAMAAYLPADGRLQAYDIMVLTVVDGMIRTISGFQGRLAVSRIRAAPDTRSMSVSR